MAVLFKAAGIAHISGMTFNPLWISLKTGVTAIAIAFLLGVLLARWRMSHRGRLGILMDGLLMLPLALPPTVVGLGLLLLLGRGSPIGRLLSAMGVQIIFSWPATVIAALVVSFPIIYQTARASFFLVDPNLLDAARIFGYSEWRILWRILLPLSWPGVASGVVLGLLRALGEFGATVMIAGNIPGRTETAPIAIFYATESGEWGEALGLSLAVTVIAVLVIGGLNKWSKNDLAAGQ